MLKSQIEEVIDDDGNLIGSEDAPESGSDRETDAAKTTDFNAAVHGQNFKNDFLGRFGMYFYESAGNEKPPVVESIAAVLEGDYSKAHGIMEAIKPHLEKVLDEMYGHMNEGNVVEDKFVKKSNKNDIKSEKSDSEISQRKKIIDILKKLPKEEQNKLKNILEDK